MEDEIRQFMKQYPTCQKFKFKKKKYRKIHLKNVELIPWDTVYIDWVGPYTVTDQKGNGIILNAMAFVDSATEWFDIDELADKISTRISQIFNNIWLSCYPRPRKVIFDNGNEFKKDFSPLLRDFSIKNSPTFIKNPQANSVLERVYQVLGNMLRKQNLQKYDFDDIDPWSELLYSVA